MDTIKSAANRLGQQGEEEEAAAVASILTPAGAALIHRIYAERQTVSMPIYMPLTEKEHFVQAAKGTGDVLSNLGDQALHELLQDDFRPGPDDSLATRYGTGGTTDKRGNLNLTVDNRLKARADALIKDQAFIAELGWKPRAASALVRRFLHEMFPMFEGLDVGQAVEAYAGGATVTELADRYQAEADVIALMLERNGVALREKNEARTGGRSLSAAEKKDIIRRYDGGEGEGTYVLAAAFGVSYRTVIRALDDAGIERRQTRGKSSPSS
ncbi:hypothetical protein ACFW81_24125 [Streptomyces angustmyceticus]|uniref:hypothetical protein n=1 Tax=Streptomyces angustmyceticus TaxID=285578 RepID=UPI0036A1029D